MLVLWAAPRFGVRARRWQGAASLQGHGQARGVGRSMVWLDKTMQLCRNCDQEIAVSVQWVRLACLRLPRSRPCTGLAHRRSAALRNRFALTGWHAHAF